MEPVAKTKVVKLEIFEARLDTHPSGMALE